MTALDAPYLQITEMKISGARGLALSGCLDVTSATRLTEAVEFAVWGTQGAFVLDLTELAFLDSTGLHALLRARAILAREDRSLALLCPPGVARRVLDLAGTLDTFAAYSSAEALEAALVPPRARIRRRMAELSGKAVAITGASSGIGEATALTLAKAGASVALGARRKDRIDELAARIEDEGGTAVALEVDVSDEEAARGFIAAAHERLGRLDTLVNNAGVMLLGPVEQADSGDWRTMINVNLLGVLYCTHAALPIMLGQESGDIVNISSVAGRFARAGNAVYAATKFGVGAFSEGLRNEVTERGVRVTLIEPGFVDTELQSHNTGAVLETLEAMREHLRDPLRAQDIANGILYAVSQPPNVSINEVLIRPTRQTR
jgi:anti-anti-sigma factor